MGSLLKTKNKNQNNTSQKSHNLDPVNPLMKTNSDQETKWYFFNLGTWTAIFNEIIHMKISEKN